MAVGCDSIDRLCFSIADRFKGKLNGAPQTNSTYHIQFEHVKVRPAEWFVVLVVIQLDLFIIFTTSAYCES